MGQPKAKSVLMVVAHYNFRDEEYTAAREKLEAAGAQVTVASTIKEAVGMHGLKLPVDVLIDEVNPADYDAVVFIGGTGASQYWHDVKAHELARAAAERGKLVAASSHAPVTLAVAGLLKGKKATGHITVFEKLTVGGADYTGSKVERDGNIVTASGANAAREFGETLAQAIRA